MITNKKGQNAIEFLTMYGWALLALLVAIVVLFYMGIFSPQRPNSCILESGISCYDFGLDTNGDLHLAMGQATGRAITITAVGCSDNETVILSPLAQNITIKNGKQAPVVGFLTNNTRHCCDPARQDTCRTEIAINYTYRGITKTLRGEVSGTLGFNVTTSNQTETPTPTPTPTPSPTPATCFGTGAVSSCPCIITEPGNYAISSDLTAADYESCITFSDSASNSTLNCQGHSISSGGGEGEGGCWPYEAKGYAAILVNGADNVSISNCEISNFRYSIFLNGSDHSEVTSNTMNVSLMGVAVRYSSENEISGNTFSNIYDRAAIDVYDGNGNIITGNTINHTGWAGISLSSSYNTVSGNTITEAQTFGCVASSGAIYSNGIGNNLSGNTITNNGNPGIKIASGDDLIENNILRNNTYAGIYSVGSGNVNITGNTITNNRNRTWASSGNGIVVSSSTNIQITNNIIQNNTRFGIFTDSSTNTILTNNNLLNNLDATYDANCSTSQTGGSGNTCDQDRIAANCNIVCTTPSP